MEINLTSEEYGKRIVKMKKEGGYRDRKYWREKGR